MATNKILLNILGTCGTWTLPWKQLLQVPVHLWPQTSTWSQPAVHLFKSAANPTANPNNLACNNKILHKRQTFLSFVAINLDFMPTRAFHGTSRFKTLDSGTINRAQGSAWVLAVGQFPFTSLLAVLLDWVSTAGYFGCVTTMSHHFVNKLDARATRLVALALAEVATSQRFLAIFKARNWLWVFVALHEK
jgi:hypothetical protein